MSTSKRKYFPVFSSRTIVASIEYSFVVVNVLRDFSRGRRIDLRWFFSDNGTFSTKVMKSTHLICHLPASDSLIVTSFVSGGAGRRTVQKTEIWKY